MHPRKIKMAICTPARVSPVADGCLLHACRIDAGVAVSPEAMIGREVRVLWPADDAWFSGTVDSYNSSSGQHRVR